MNRALSLPLWAALLVLAACATIHPRFPTAEAEIVAEQVVDNVLGRRPAAPASSAQTIDAGSPESLRLQASMEARLEQLRPYYDSGGAGFGEDGYVAVPDQDAISLAERNRLNTLVANENADRAALYREIALASGQRRWDSELRNCFARRWTGVAQQSGWAYQAAGGWVK